MGYNVDISVNLTKETNFSEIASTIKDIAKYYDYNNMYSISEEDGTKKVLRYQYVFTINFLDENFESFIKFLKYMKNYKKSYIECIYTNDEYKLLYASSYYLKSIDKDFRKRYKNFINNNIFTENENLLVKEFIRRR